MSKKVTTLAIALVLLLVAFAPLVLAQQNTAPDQSAGQAQAAPPIDLANPFVLDENNNLVIDCGVAFGNLAQLEPFRRALADDPEFQSRLSAAEDLVRLCTQNGFSPFVAPGGSGNTGMEQYQGDRASEPLA